MIDIREVIQVKSTVAKPNLWMENAETPNFNALTTSQRVWRIHYYSTISSPEKFITVVSAPQSQKSRCTDGLP
ncbi:hypothetical protein M434DRAFT_33627 [Hypoxylon sp. CO27-5]|nr:hypothetical protein M434DRAFT_33627 [Hypoxylon sp. CO27-5]